MSSLLLHSLFLLVPLVRPPAFQKSADEQYRFLVGLVEKDLHELAVTQAQQFLRDYPEHPKAALARYRLAGALWELDRRDEAAREYETLGRVESFEYRAESLFRAGESALERGDVARAEAAFGAVLRAGQDYLIAPALFSLGETAFRARRFEEAERHHAELLATHPDCEQAPLARRALAWCAWERGDAGETVARARTALELSTDPSQRDELRLLCSEALLGSDPRAALEILRSIESAEQSGARRRGEGFALSALGDHAGAAAAFEALLASEPGGRFAQEAALQAGIERLRAGDARSAVKHLALASRKGDAETLYWLAQAQQESGDSRAALSTLEQALHGKPERALVERIQVLRGDCLAAEGRGGEALNAYESAGSSAALYAGAVTALNQGDHADAARLAESVLRAGGAPGADRRVSETQGARVVLAEALFALERYAESERALTAALERPSDAAEAARLASRLAWCRYLSGDLAAARERFAALLERHERAPEAEEALAMLVRIGVEARDGAGARTSAERYLERFPQGRFLDQALLALARGTSGDGTRARYAELLERCPDSPLRATAWLELGDLESAAGQHESAARRYLEVLKNAKGTPEAARASYGLAWCAWERKEHAACERALGGLLRAEHCPAELRGPALELLIWTQVEQQHLEPSLETWRALAALQGDEGRRLEAARRIVAALREAERLEPARALLAECARTLTDRALVASAELESAYLALDARDLPAAEAALTAARKGGADATRVAEAGYHLGEAYLAEGPAQDEARARKLLEGAAASTGPRAADALYRLGFLRLSQGELEAAEQALSALLERFPGSELAGEARFLAGECAFRRGRHEEAARHFDAVLRDAQGELRSRALFRAGLSLGQLQRWSESASALAELASTFPRFPNLAEAELARGRALLAQGQTRPARAALERTLALDQGDLAAAARLALGRVHEAEGRSDDALSEYLKVALLYAHEESVAEALYRAGAVLEQQGSAQKAIERYRELCEQHPRSPFANPARERLRALGQR